MTLCCAGDSNGLTNNKFPGFLHYLLAFWAYNMKNPFRTADDGGRTGIWNLGSPKTEERRLALSLALPYGSLSLVLIHNTETWLERHFFAFS